MTQEQLAMLLGVSRQSVSKWEAEKAYPEMDKLLNICSLFDCSLDDLVKGDLTSRASGDAFAVPLNTTPQDVTDYDGHMRRHANRVSGGVAFIIAGLAFTALLEGTNLFAGSDPDTFGAICCFVGIAIGLAFIIPSGMEHAAFVREHPFIEDFYTSDQKRVARKNLSWALVCGIALILCGVIVAALLQGNERIAGFTFFVLMAAGVWLIVRFGMLSSRMDVRSYNDGALDGVDLDGIDDPKIRTRARRKKKTEALCGIIMSCATALGLVLLFIPNPLNNYFWVVWPVGGVLCGVVSKFMVFFEDDI
jgi:transcriptional regulator with XRE-family HTH domain